MIILLATFIASLVEYCTTYKAGLSTYDLSQDEQANISPVALTTNQQLYERAITKVFTHCAIPSFRSKLWRMGLSFVS